MTDAVLADGGAVHIRPITPDDADGYRSLHARLSSVSVYYRYFSARPKLSDKDIAFFTTVDYQRRFAIVAELGGELIGVARYDRHEDSASAEVAFDVDDEHHGRGVATLLLEVLAVAAIARGIDTFTASVLRDNAKMLGVFRAAGWEVSRSYDSGVVELNFNITSTEASEAARFERERLADLRSVRPLLEPESIAVIGASDSPGSVGRAVVEGLVAHGFQGALHVVHPRLVTVAGLESVGAMSDIAGDVDLAIICIPASSVEAIVSQCAEKHVRALIVMSAGFDGVDVVSDSDLAAIVRRTGMRLLGPASSGVHRVADGRCMHAIAVACNPRGGAVALSVHAGILVGALVEMAAEVGVGFSTVVSTGARADVTGRDLLSFWEHDNSTRVICMHLPGLAYPKKFARVTRRVGRSKPIVIAGSGSVDRDPTTLALFEQAGVIHVEGPRDLFDAARVLLDQPLPTGPRVAVISNAFGMAQLARDAMAVAGLVPAMFSATAIASLELLGARVDGPIVELSTFTPTAQLLSAIDLVLESSGVDAVVAGLVPPAGEDSNTFAQAVHETVARTRRTIPLVAVVAGRRDGVLFDGDTTVRVPQFAFPEAAVMTLGRIAAYANWLARDPGTAPEPGWNAADPSSAPSIARMLLGASNTRFQLSLSDAGGFLNAAQVRAVDTAEVADVASAMNAAERIGFPVCLKIIREHISPGEAGGVALDLHTADEVRYAWSRMVDSDEQVRARIDGDRVDPIVVQAMVSPGQHLRITLDQHPMFGGVIGLSAGGSHAEELHERAVRLLPLTDTDAKDLVARSRVRSVLSNAEAAIVEALLLRVAALGEHVPEVESLSMNPVLLTDDGPVAVGWRVTLAPSVPDNDSFRRVL